MKVSVVRRRRLKYIRLSIRDFQTVRVTVPPHFSERDIDKLLSEKKSWILKHFARMRERKDRHAQSAHQVLFRGDVYDIVFAEFMSESVLFDADTKQCRIRGDLRTRYKSTIDAYLRKEAKTVILSRLEAINTRFGCRYARVFIRSQKTRWGTCSSRGNLSFNWKLIKAPPHILDYVICHELAHLKHMDHSRAYWNHLATLFPEYKAARKWLKDLGHTLHASA